MFKIILLNSRPLGRNWRAHVRIHPFRAGALYVAERFGKADAWIDGVRVGVYADLHEAKEAVLKSGAQNHIKALSASLVALPALEGQHVLLDRQRGLVRRKAGERGRYLVEALDVVGG
jgi:hypothetical protein